jgi:hypothetical protein
LKNDRILISFILIILGVVVMISGCTDSTGSNTTNNATEINNDLQKNIVIENVTITPSKIGKGYNAKMKVTYTGDKPINYRLVVEPYPMYGTTQGESEIPDQKIQPIRKGDSFMFEFNDIGGYSQTDPSEITGVKFLIAVNYEETNNSINADDSFYTPVYPVTK